MPHQELEKYIWIVEILVGLATMIWGILTYRIWDIQKTLGAKVDLGKFDEDIKNLESETKKDFRYFEEKMSKQIAALAKDLKREIRSIK